MREILFRGKHIHVLPQNKHLNGTWVYGYLSGENYINTIDEDEYGGEFTSEVLVDPETVCQYTGLTDKNGRKIFEGDIVRVDEKIYIAFWNEYNFEIGIRNNEESMGIAYVHPSDIEVIGNIFDNPELVG